jgi:hypothetical protein
VLRPYRVGRCRAKARRYGRKCTGLKTTSFQSEIIEDFAFSHDGKSMALLRGHVTKDVVLIKDTGR